MLNEDYRDILRSLSGREVRFLVVGAYALGVHGYPRATGDFDIWIDSSPENSRKIYAALADFGAPLADLTERTFTEEGVIFQIGVAPRRIDLITHIDGVRFQDAYASRVLIEVEGIGIPFISREDLIRNKLSTGREKDRLDAEYLKRDQSD